MIVRLIPRISLIFMILASMPVHSEAIVAGWIERVIVITQDQRLAMKAKLDTGAKTTSINSPDYKLYKKEGADWVKFKVTNFNDKILYIDEPVIRYTKIKRHFSKNQIRPVIELELCLGGISKTTQVNLVDRGRFQYQLLVGRRYLENGIIVDSTKKYIADSGC